MRAKLAIAVILTTLGLSISGEAFEYPNCNARTLKSYDLLGPVRSVRVEEPVAAGRRELVASYAFDRRGRVLEDRSRVTLGDDPPERDTPEHTGYQVFRSIYEPHGRNYEIDIFEIDSAQGEQPIDLQRHLVKFDSLDRCIEERDLDSDGEISGQDTYQYDKHGDLTKIIQRVSDGKMLSLQTRAYTADHKLISEKALDDRGQGLTYRWSREYRYDAQGNPTDMFSYQEGILQAHWIYAYDERNRLISSETIVADPHKDQQTYGSCSDCGLSSGKTTFEYDSTGRKMVARMFLAGHRLVRAQYHFYDAKGNEVISPNSTYEYDSHGNWVKEVTPDRTPRPVRFRVIEYY